MIQISHLIESQCQCDGCKEARELAQHLVTVGEEWLLAQHDGTVAPVEMQSGLSMATGLAYFGVLASTGCKQPIAEAGAALLSDLVYANLEPAGNRVQDEALHAAPSPIVH